MEKIRGIDLAEIGHKRTIIGMVLGSPNGDGTYVLMLPDEEFINDGGIHEFQLDINDWEKILKQMDTLQVEVTQGKHLPKVILRKSQRNIEQSISWEVYRRDNFTCRYCANDKVPMTIDHLILWENGGPSIVKNLLCSCKKCNRTRGNMEYEDWLNSDYYKKVSVNLPNSIRIANFELIEEIKNIEINKNKRKR